MVAVAESSTELPVPLSEPREQKILCSLPPILYPLDSSLQMDRSNPDTAGAFSLFKQRMQMFFRLKKIDKELQVDHLLLTAGEQGLKSFNSWTDMSNGDKKNPDKVWTNLEQHLTCLKPKHNFRLERLSLQKADESVDDYIAHCKTQAAKCDFRDDTEVEDCIIEQIIAGIQFPEIQKELLSKDNTVKLPAVVDICRSFEATNTHMNQFSNMQNKGATATANVHAVGLRNRHMQRHGNLQQEAQGLGALLDKMEDNDHINWITQISKCIFHSKTRFLKIRNTSNDPRMTLTT